MLSLTIFFPLLTGFIILLIPATQGRLIRTLSLLGALVTLTLSFSLWSGMDSSGSLFQWRHQLPWIPSIHATYDVAVDGFSLPLIMLTSLLLVSVMIYVFDHSKMVKAHSFLFLLMATGLIGLFSSQDLLLFYLFFEVGLVPMYFIIGNWGHENRRYAAMKFFLYTRLGSLAILLSFLGLYFLAEPHTFSIPEIIEAQPLQQAGHAGAWIMAGMLIGFGVKLPLVPLHNWLPDAHVEAPTEGSVMLAGVQLKMGAFGLLRILLPTVPQVSDYGWLFVTLGLLSLIYGALAAIGQTDIKRLVAYTSVNHMAYVLIAVGVYGLSQDPNVRQLALNGGMYQIISHGILTGGMFFIVGMLQDGFGTREMNDIGGLLGRLPIFSFILAILTFGSLGLPGLSGFVAEFQVIGAALSTHFLIAVFIVIGLAITTGLYLKLLGSLLFGSPQNEGNSQTIPVRHLVVVGSLALLSLVLGIVPQLLLDVIHATTGSLIHLNVGGRL